MATIKTLKHGTGSGKNAINYILNEVDHKGEQHQVDVLEGDPRAVADVIDSLDFKWRYSSTVISFAPEDKPTATEINAMLHDWKRMAYAGLEHDRIAYTIVQHTSKDGRVDIHAITARVDLETGKSFNPAPPKSLYAFDHVRDKHNYLNGWARPDDPNRARLVQPGYEAHAPKSRVALTEYIKEMAAEGLVTNAQEVKAELEQIGEITRHGKDYIRVKPEGASRAITLKGEVFGNGWTAGNTVEREARKAITRATSRGGIVDIDAAARAEREIERCIERRTAVNLSKYKPCSSRDQAAIERDRAQLEQDKHVDIGRGLERSRYNDDTAQDTRTNRRSHDWRDQSASIAAHQERNEASLYDTKEHQSGSTADRENAPDDVDKASRNRGGHNRGNVSDDDRHWQTDRRTDQQEMAATTADRTANTTAPEVSTDDRDRADFEPAARADEGREGGGNSGIARAIAATTAAISEFRDVCKDYAERVREFFSERERERESSSTISEPSYTESARSTGNSSGTDDEFKRALEALQRATEELEQQNRENRERAERLNMITEKIEYQQMLQQQSRDDYDLEL